MIMTKNISLDKNKDNRKVGEMSNLSSNPRKKGRCLSSRKEILEVANEENTDIPDKPNNKRYGQTSS